MDRLALFSPKVQFTNKNHISPFGNLFFDDLMKSTKQRSLFEERGIRYNARLSRWDSRQAFPLPNWQNRNCINVGTISLDWNLHHLRSLNSDLRRLDELKQHHVWCTWFCAKSVKMWNQWVDPQRHQLPMQWPTLTLLFWGLIDSLAYSSIIKNETNLWSRRSNGY
jgi:hypothetical protein